MRSLLEYWIVFLQEPQALCANGGVAIVELAVQALANSTQGYSGADLSNLCQEAALMAARQDLHGASHVAAEHFEAALLHLQPSVWRTSGHGGMTFLDSCEG